jgi:hypothetical protein
MPGRADGLVLALALALGVPARAMTPSARPPRGYQARASGFDHDGNGTFDTAVCNGSDSTADVDVDGNGVVDHQCYVDCTGGTDTVNCGAPGSPCKTLQYCMNGSNTSTNARWRIGTPAAQQMQAVCFKGTCGNAQLQLTQSGAAGTWTKAITGSEDRTFQFPRYPLIISGWDADGDHDYPPHDPDDIAIVDGNVSGNTDSFFDSNGQSRYEVAHFTISDYNQGCVSGASVFAPGGGANVSHAYFHDLNIVNFSRGCSMNCPASGVEYIMWEVYTGAGTTLQYFAVDNVNISDYGGYLLRGSSPSDLTPTVTSGPWRFENLSATARPSSICGSVLGFKPWSRISGLEVLDSIVNAQSSLYGPDSTASHVAMIVAQCVTNVTVRNNAFLDWKQSIDVQPSASGGCSNIDVDNVVVDANELRNTYTGWSNVGHVVVIENPNDGSSSQAAQNRTYTNNVISSADTDARAAFYLNNSRSSGAITGALTIEGNTVDMEGATCNLGGIGFCTGGECLAQKDQSVTIKNNILLGCATGAYIINVNGFTPATFVSDYNLFQSDTAVNFALGGTGYASLASRQAGTGQDMHSIGGFSPCTPTFVSAATGDYHLASGDSCVRDVGTSAVIATATSDYDGQARPLNSIYDIGADEFGVGGTTKTTTLPTTTTTTTGASPTSTTTSTTRAPTTTTSITTSTTRAPTTTSSTSSTSSTTGTASSSSSTTLPPGIVCGNQYPSGGGLSVGWDSYAGVPCMTGNDPAGYVVVNAHVYAGQPGDPPSFRLGLYESNGASGSKPDPAGPPLCESDIVSLVAGDNLLALPDCPVLAPSTQYYLIFVAASPDTQLGDVRRRACAHSWRGSTGRHTSGVDSLSDPFPDADGLQWLRDYCQETLWLYLVPAAQ